jgi:hypothetical protein
MKKFIIAAVALGALAGAASAAQNRTYDLRDLETVNGYTSDGAFLPVLKAGKMKAHNSMQPVLPIIDHTGEHQNSTI